MQANSSLNTVTNAVVARFQGKSFSESAMQDLSSCGKFLRWICPFLYIQERNNVTALRAAEAEFLDQFMKLKVDVGGEIRIPQRITVAGKIFYIETQGNDTYVWVVGESKSCWPWAVETRRYVKCMPNQLKEKFFNDYLKSRETVAEFDDISELDFSILSAETLKKIDWSAKTISPKQLALIARAGGNLCGVYTRLSKGDGGPSFKSINFDHVAMDPWLAIELSNAGADRRSVLKGLLQTPRNKPALCNLDGFDLRGLNLRTLDLRNTRLLGARYDEHILKAQLSEPVRKFIEQELASPRGGSVVRDLKELKSVLGACSSLAVHIKNDIYAFQASDFYPLAQELDNIHYGNEFLGNISIENMVFHNGRIVQHRVVSEGWTGKASGELPDGVLLPGLQRDQYCFFIAMIKAWKPSFNQHLINDAGGVASEVNKHVLEEFVSMLVPESAPDLRDGLKAFLLNPGKLENHHLSTLQSYLQFSPATLIPAALQA